MITVGAVAFDIFSPIWAWVKKKIQKSHTIVNNWHIAKKFNNQYSAITEVFIMIG